MHARNCGEIDTLPQEQDEDEQRESRPPVLRRVIDLARMSRVRQELLPGPLAGGKTGSVDVQYPYLRGVARSEPPSARWCTTLTARRLT